MLKANTMRVPLISLILTISHVASLEGPNSTQVTKNDEKTTKDNEIITRRNGNWFPEVVSQDSHLLELMYAKLESFEIRLSSMEENLKADLAKHVIDAEQRLNARLIGVKFSAMDGIEKMKVVMSVNEQRLTSLVESVTESLRDRKCSTEDQLRTIQTQLSSTEQRQASHLTSLVSQIEDKIKIHAKYSGVDDRMTQNIDALLANVFDDSRFDNFTADVYAYLDRLIGEDIKTSLQLSELDEKVTRKLDSVRQTLHHGTETIRHNMDDKLDIYNERLDNLTSTLQSVFDAHIHGNSSNMTTLLVSSRCERGQTGLPYNDSFPYPLIYPGVGSDITSPYLCDTTTNGGGWVVIHHRSSGDENFYRGWSDYKRGFGSLTGDFWLGLDAVYNLTSKAKCELRVELEYEGKSAYAYYSTFSVGPESDNYRLNIGGYSGTAGDSLASRHDDMEFTTFDKDNDNYNINCAIDRKGAWWYADCYDSNLNGLWNKTGGWTGVAWNKFTGSRDSASFVEMKIRPAV